jgi:hypothetical protein
MSRTFQFLSVVLVGLSCFTSAADGQGLSPFQGRGIKETQGSAPNWFGNSAKTVQSPEQTSEPRSWFGQGIMRPARPGEMEQRPALFGNLFQRPDANEPGMMQKASDRSREMWERTRSWAADRNEAFRNRASQNWETLTSGLRPAAAEDRSAAPEPFRSPLRSAEKPDATKTERF